MRVWAVANQKGGVGKTTTSVTLAGLLCGEGKRVLLLDLDPHGSLTSYFGLDPDALETSAYTLFQRVGAGKSMNPLALVRETQFEGLALLPASPALATLDRQLGSQEGMGLVVARALREMSDRFDQVLIDCPPMLGVLMVNALAACRRLLIPVQTDFLALKGLERMVRTLAMVQRARGMDLPHTIVPTMYDPNARSALMSLKTLQESYPEEMLWPGQIPVEPLFRDASRGGAPLSLLLPEAKGVQAYRLLLQYLVGLEQDSTDAVAS